ncbi:MAG: HAD hydrolase family protein [Endomicrobiaceae bacterium]|jgi:YrbI family 3-deoxy-D-manno-octulosonate 8-phosphate phosphatase|nr:HAD hydrolase family protein [Endomicrobiaceae bacterium]
MKKYSKQLLSDAKKIKLIATDIDGVLTAGEVILLENNEEIKIWNVKDRLGSTLLRTHLPDVKVAWITGRQSKQVSLRAKELSVDYLIQSCKNKKEALVKIANDLEIDFSKILYIGDDIIDISALKYSGISFCPKDASDDVKKCSKYISQYDGGKGVFREACEILLKANNLWKEIIG